MTNHRIDLQAPEKGHGKTLMAYLGQPIGASDSPIFAAAGWLLANGMASLDDTVVTYRGETLCMSGKASESAKWTVKERDRGGLSLEPYFAFPRMAQKPASHPSPVLPCRNPSLRILGHDRARHCNRRIIPLAIAAT